MVKNSPFQCGRPRLDPWGQEDSLEKGMATHSSILAWRNSWTEEPGGLQSTELQRGGHNWATNTQMQINIWYRRDRIPGYFGKIQRGRWNTIQQSSKTLQVMHEFTHSKHGEIWLYFMSQADACFISLWNQSTDYPLLFKRKALRDALPSTGNPANIF